MRLLNHPTGWKRGRKGRPRLSGGRMWRLLPRQAKNATDTTLRARPSAGGWRSPASVIPPHANSFQNIRGRNFQEHTIEVVARPSRSCPSAGALSGILEDFSARWNCAPADGQARAPGRSIAAQGQTEQDKMDPSRPWRIFARRNSLNINAAIRCASTMRKKPSPLWGVGWVRGGG